MARHVVRLSQSGACPRSRRFSEASSHTPRFISLGLYLGYISAISRLYLGCISAISPKRPARRRASHAPRHPRASPQLPLHLPSISHPSPLRLHCVSTASPLPYVVPIGSHAPRYPSVEASLHLVPPRRAGIRVHPRLARRATRLLRAQPDVSYRDHDLLRISATFTYDGGHFSQVRNRTSPTSAPVQAGGSAGGGHAGGAGRPADGESEGSSWEWAEHCGGTSHDHFRDHFSGRGAHDL